MFIWDGSSSTDWAKGANWSLNRMPGSGDTVRFNATTPRDPDLGNKNRAVGKFEFLSGTDAEMIGGSKTLTINGVSGTGVTNSSGVGQTFAPKIALGNSQSWTTINPGSDLSFNNTLDLTGHSLLIDTGAGSTVTVSGSIANGTGNLTKAGAGTLVFNQAFTAPSLTLVLSGGTLALASSAQITVGTIHITGNTILDFSNSAGTFLSSSNLVIDAGVTITVNRWMAVANNAARSTVWYVSNTVNGSTLSGTAQVGGTPLNQIAFTNYSGLTTWTTQQNGWFEHEIRPSPEPATYGCGLVGAVLSLVAFRRVRAALSGG